MDKRVGGLELILSVEWNLLIMEEITCLLFRVSRSGQKLVFL